MTVQGFLSVSLVPPLVLFSTGRGARAWPTIEASGTSASTCSGPTRSGSRSGWPPGVATGSADVDWSPSPVTGSPLLAGGLGHVDCRTESVHDAGDHLLVVGRVVDLGATDAEDALLYYRGRYGRTRPGTHPRLAGVRLHPTRRRREADPVPPTRERPAFGSDQRTALLGWYDLQRGIVVLKCEGLSDEDARRSVIPTSPLMTAAGIVSHLTWAEQLWFEHAFLGRDSPGPRLGRLDDSEFAVADRRWPRCWRRTTRSAAQRRGDRGPRPRGPRARAASSPRRARPWAGCCTTCSRRRPGTPDTSTWCAAARRRDRLLLTVVRLGFRHAPADRTGRLRAGHQGAPLADRRAGRRPVRGRVIPGPRGGLRPRRVRTAAGANQRPRRGPAWTGWKRCARRTPPGSASTVGTFDLPELHLILGLSILAMGVTRMLWRRFDGFPSWSDALSVRDRRLVHWTERVLMLLLLLCRSAGCCW